MLGVTAFLMIIVSAVLAATSGRIDEVSAALLSGADDAVSLCFRIGGAVCFFSGMVKVAEKCGVTKAFSKILRPVIRRLIPLADGDESIETNISMNISSNILGLGNAATPPGMKASRLLAAKSGGEMSLSLATFLIINTSSVQLIPSTAAAIRASYGSAAPFDIILPVLLTQACSCAFGILLLRAVYGITEKRHETQLRPPRPARAYRRSRHSQKG
ncbi:MAG: nucleoside recognition domain-containing protein [Eubacteriales bacterium]